MNPKMTEVLKLSNKDFKVAIIIMLNEVKENMLLMSKKMRNIFKEIKNVKKKINENLEPKNHNI